MNRVILIFIDGLGLGSRDNTKNPCAGKNLKLLSCFDNGNESLPIAGGGLLIPTEATLGVGGLPQSATGQTTLLTGVNCSQLLGRHLPGYPNERLREVLRELSVLKQVKELGLRSAFINAYRPIFFKLKEKTQWRLSTTTVATLAADIPFFKVTDIPRGKSIYHDFTNESLISRGFSLPLFSSQEAAHILAKVSKTFHLTLYEYFLTDRAGHSNNMEMATREIEKLDSFLSALLEEVDLDKNLIILTSDHGNIEDLSTITHTRNKVMTILWGRGTERIFNQIHSIEDISPIIIKFLKNSINT